MNTEYVEISASFIWLKIDKPEQIFKPGQISKPEQIFKPVFDKSLVIIVIESLHNENENFTKINLKSGENAIVSEDESQFFLEGKRGSKINIIMRIKYAIESST